MAPAATRAAQNMAQRPQVARELLDAARTAAGKSQQASAQARFAVEAVARETDPAKRDLLEQLAGFLAQRAGQAEAHAKAAAEAASRRPFGDYNMTHQNIPGHLSRWLGGKWDTLTHLAGQAATRAPAAVGGASGVVMKDQRQ